MKNVTVIGHTFGCLPGHVTIPARGSGGTTRVATIRAVSNLMDAEKLRGKRIREFKITVVVEPNPA